MAEVKDFIMSALEYNEELLNSLEAKILKQSGYIESYKALIAISNETQIATESADARLAALQLVNTALSNYIAREF